MNQIVRKRNAKYSRAMVKSMNKNHYFEKGVNKWKKYRF